MDCKTFLALGGTLPATLLNAGRRVSLALLKALVLHRIPNALGIARLCSSVSTQAACAQELHVLLVLHFQAAAFNSIAHGTVQGLEPATTPPPRAAERHVLLV